MGCLPAQPPIGLVALAIGARLVFRAGMLAYCCQHEDAKCVFMEAAAPGRDMSTGAPHEEHTTVPPHRRSRNRYRMHDARCAPASHEPGRKPRPALVLRLTDTVDVIRRTIGRSA